MNGPLSTYFSIMVLLPGQRLVLGLLHPTYRLNHIIRLQAAVGIFINEIAKVLNLLANNRLKYVLLSIKIT